MKRMNPFTVAFRKLFKNKLATICFFLIIIELILVIFAPLFTQYDPLEIIIWRDIFRYLEQCADACEHVADAAEKAYMNNT